jgi:hypothetical protein
VIVEETVSRVDSLLLVWSLINLLLSLGIAVMVILVKKELVRVQQDLDYMQRCHNEELKILRTQSLQHRNVR